jgi:hypothetical protein
VEEEGNLATVSDHNLTEDAAAAAAAAEEMLEMERRTQRIQITRTQRGFSYIDNRICDLLHRV